MIAAPSGLVHCRNWINTFYTIPLVHGVEYALGRHRSWHVLEALLFGKALTRTDKYPLTDTGPKIRKSSVNNMNPVLIPL